MRYCAHLGYQFTELDFERRFEAASEAGFSAVEAPAPYVLSARRVAQLLREFGLTYVQLASPIGISRLGEKGYAARADKVRAFRASVDEVLDYAEEIGCAFFHPMAGVISDEADHQRAWEVYLSNLSYSASAAAARNIAVLVEPISAGTIPCYFIDSFDKAMRAVDVSPGNVRILLDTFHCAVFGIDPTTTYKAHANRIGHVHVADHPGRHEPGTGALDFGSFFSTLASSGYNGFVGCEYIPTIMTEEKLGWMTNVMRGAAAHD